MIYYIIVILLFFASLSNLKETSNKLDFVKWGWIFFFIIFGGLRVKVGADWGAYEFFFLDINTLSDVINSRFEKGFGLLSFLIKNISQNFSIYILIIFIISFSLKVYVIKKISVNFYISLIIYFYTAFIIYDINGIRQGIAIGLTMCALLCIIKKNQKLFYILVSLAACFHITAIVFFPFYILSDIKITSLRVIQISAIFFILAIPLRTLLLKSSLPLLLGSDELNRYAIYATDTDYKMNISIFGNATLQRLFILYYFIYRYKYISIDSRIKLILRNGYFYSIILFLLLSFSVEYAGRISFYYKALEIIMIPLIIYSYKQTYTKILVFILFVLMALFCVYNFLSLPDFGYLLPYNNLFF